MLAERSCREIWFSANCTAAIEEYVYDYESSTTVQHLECIAFIVLHRSPELRSRAGAKEEQIRM